MSDPLFQRSLQDLIKGIRSHKKDPSSFVSQTVVDIKQELRSTDPFVKTEAVRKLTHLQMIGYNVSWASFAIVEVMSLPRFAHKRIGYLAANQSFTEATDVILLTTNLFKKEFSSATNNQYEIALAINALANIANKDLARDCISDLVTLMNHSRPYVRKKAVLAMFKLYIKFPQGLRLTFDKLKERLDDSESSVVSTAVNVICELANKNPKNYLAMAPKFFRLLTTSSNNWMLIKVVKLLGSLVSEEPRLARKLLEPLITIIQNTGAKSLQYECIHTVALALPYTRRDDGTDAKNAPQVIKICSDYLKGFIEDPDQNLKYLGLVGLVDLMKSNPRSVVDHRELVLKCLTDDDVTIRTRALELLAGIVSRKSLVDLVHHLLEHVKHAEGQYRDEIIAKVLYMCSKDKYGLVTDFAWYTSVLLDLAVMQGSKHGKEVADQLIEIALRVDTVRPYAVESMLSMLLNDSLILGQARQTVSEVLKAAAWIVGEYAEIVSSIAADTADADDDDNGYWIEGPTGEDIRSAWRGQSVHVLAVDALLHPRATNLPTHVQSAYVQSAMKVFVRACVDCNAAEVASLVGIVRNRLGVFLQSLNIEVQERASTFRHLLAEMEVLPLNWENSAVVVESPEEAAATGGIVKGSKGKKSSSKAAAAISAVLHKEEDLLDFPVYTASSVKAVDDGGAEKAKLKSRVLAAAVGENFYAVHSKAQRRVPVPEGLDLEKAFNPSALNKLLAVEIPENLTLTNLSFTDTKSSYSAQDHGGDDHFTKLSSVLGAEDEHRDRASYSAFGNDSNPPKGSSIAAAAIAATGGSAPQRTAEDNLFYLSSSRPTADVVPLSQILADTFEDNKKVKGGKKGKKGEKDKKSRKHHHKGETEVDTREMLPAGAMSSDDEDARGSKPKASGGSGGGGRKKGGDDLDSMDITRPLGLDEVMPTLQHRQVPAFTAPATDEEDGKDGKKKKKDHHKEKDGKGDKSKKDKHHHKDGDGDKKKSKDGKEKKKSKSGGGDGVGDLLMMDFGDSHPTPTAAAVGGLDTSAATASSAADKDKKHKDKKEKKKVSHVWLPLVKSPHATVSYSVAITGQTVAVTFRAENTSKDGASITVNIAVTGNFSLRFTNPSAAMVRVAQHLAPGDDAESSTEMLSDVAVLTSPLQAGCNIQIIAEQLVGPEVVQLQGLVKVPICAAFTPHKVDEQGFAVLVGKSSSKSASAVAKVPVSGKAKSALKAIAGFLHAHLVESESSKAASLAAKTPSGHTICALAKANKEGSQISVDVKCLCGSKAESQSLADGIVAALADLHL